MKEERNEEMEEKEVIEEEMEDEVEEYTEDIEERIVNAEDMEREKVEIELHHFDCDEILGMAGEKAEIDSQTDKVAGEIERRKVVLRKLIEKAEEVYMKIKEKKGEIKDRYDLSDDYEWTIDVYEGVAKGVKKL